MKLILITSVAVVVGLMVACGGSSKGDAFYNKGVEYLDQGKYHEAVQMFDKAIQNNPKDTDAYGARGDSYFELGEYQRAIENFDMAIALNKKDSYAYFGRGLAYNFLGTHDKAVEDYSKAIQLDPNDMESHFNRGQIYLYEWDEYELAFQDFDKAVELDPDDTDARLERAYVSDILYGQTKSNEAKLSPSEPVQSTDTQDEREAKYLTDIDSIGDSFYINKTFYSSELERIGEKLRTASDEQDLAEAYEEVIPLFQDVASRFRQDLDDTRLIPPAPRFKEFHLLLVDAIDDAHGSAQAFLTLYSMARNSGVIEGDIASRASELHKSANQKSLEAGYMFRELCPKCD